MGAVRATTPTRAKANPASERLPLDLEFHDVFQAYVYCSTAIHFPLLLRGFCITMPLLEPGCWRHSAHLAGCSHARVIQSREFIELLPRMPSD
jgi:hypothetical protein